MGDILTTKHQKTQGIQSMTNIARLNDTITDHNTVVFASLSLAMSVIGRWQSYGA